MDAFYPRPVHSNNRVEPSDTGSVLYDNIACDDILMDEVIDCGDEFEDFVYSGCFDNDNVSDDSDSMVPNEDMLKLLLAAWAVQFCISLSAVGSLLHILHDHHPQLPKDARTLLNTPTNKTTKTLSCGNEYYYFGIANGITKL
ncbi:MAG: hypothetical protein WAX04_02280 [Oscillospiraceae bacterium]